MCKEYYCGDEPYLPIIIPCGHTFCWQCLKLGQKQCPICTKSYMHEECVINVAVRDWLGENAIQTEPPLALEKTKIKAKKAIIKANLLQTINHLKSLSETLVANKKDLITINYEQVCEAIESKFRLVSVKVGENKSSLETTLRGLEQKSNTKVEQDRKHMARRLGSILKSLRSCTIDLAELKRTEKNMNMLKLALEKSEKDFERQNRLTRFDPFLIIDKSYLGTISEALPQAQPAKQSQLKNQEQLQHDLGQPEQQTQSSNLTCKCKWKEKGMFFAAVTEYFWCN